MTKNGYYSKTFPGLGLNAENTVASGRDFMIQNLTSNASYRSSIGFFNGSASPLTLEFRLYDASGSVIGSMFSQTLSSGGFYSVNPFAADGIPYPAYAHDNVWLHLTATSGLGSIMVYGATANNASNDPASHLPTMYNDWEN